MRHRRAVKKLSRNTSNRKALLRSLVTNLMVHERISTTYEKAKEASILADKLITLGKRNTITSKKSAISMLGSKSLINKLFDETAPRFITRSGGYTRVLQLASRKGDGAKMAILELTERKIIEKAAPKKKRAKQTEEELKAPKKVSPREEKRPERPERPEGVPVRGEVPDEVKGKKKTAEKEKPHAAPTPPKAAPISTKEKIDEEKGKERAKSEKEKMKKGFFKGLRRYFRGRSA